MTSKKLTVEKQLEVACTVDPWRAAQVLEVYHHGRWNGIPDQNWFVRLFTFTPQELREYISRHDTGLTARIYGSGLFRHGIPNPYLQPAGDYYEAGWFDGKHSRQRIHHSIVDAAADYVLLFWGLPRD